jgi:antitoxin VapB
MIGGVILASPLVTWQERLRWHILLYMPALWRKTMQRKAKLFMNNRSQAVRLPKEFQFNATEVFIRRHGDEVILSPRPVDWTAYLVSGPVASKEFMEAVDDLRVQEREL